MIYYENLALLNQAFADEFQQAFQEVLQGGWFIEGEKLNQFEQAFAKYCQVAYCIGISNGLDALKLSIIALDLPPQSEIIVPAHTFIATIYAVIHAGHIPILVEPDLETYTISPQRIEEKITTKTKAIIPVHLYGKLCDMPSIAKIAQAFDLKIIEDAAQAHGASYQGKVAGSFGDLAAFSFYPAKNLGALGDAGAILTNNTHYTLKIQKLRSYGAVEKYHHEMIGYNNRLDELQAAFLSVKLKYLDEINQHKRKLALIYLKELKADFIKPVLNPDYEDVFHIFPIRHIQRDRLRAYLTENNIQTGIHYLTPPHQQKALHKLIGKQDYPITEKIHETILSLPISYIHREEDIYQVIETINKFST